MFKALMFSKEALFDILAYTDKVGELEICGIGRIQEDQAGIKYVSEIKILPQEVGGADVNVTEKDMTEFFKTIPEEQHPEWCFNWHSHVNMGVTPSSTDLTNYKGFADLFDTFVPMIFNKRGEFNGWVYQAAPCFGTYEIEDIWLIELKKFYHHQKLKVGKDQRIPLLRYILENFSEEEIVPEERLKFIEAEIKEKVTTRRGKYLTGDVDDLEDYYMGLGGYTPYSRHASSGSYGGSGARQTGGSTNSSNFRSGTITNIPARVQQITHGGKIPSKLYDAGDPKSPYILLSGGLKVSEEDFKKALQFANSCEPKMYWSNRDECFYTTGSSDSTESMELEEIFDSMGSGTVYVDRPGDDSDSFSSATVATGASKTSESSEEEKAAEEADKQYREALYKDLKEKYEGQVAYQRITLAVSEWMNCSDEMAKALGVEDGETYFLHRDTLRDLVDDEQLEIFKQWRNLQIELGTMKNEPLSPFDYLDFLKEKGKSFLIKRAAKKWQETLLQYHTPSEAKGA